MAPSKATPTPREKWTGRRPNPETTALLANRRIRAWYDERSLRSKLSADNDLRKLRLTLERLGLGPDELVKVARADPDDLRARLVRYAADLKRKGRLAVYVAKTFSGLRSFLDHAHVEFEGYPKLELIKGASIETERIPTPEELGRVLERLSLRSRVAALFIAHAGLRPQVLGTYQGERGLTLADLPELELGGGVAFTRAPFVVRVPAALSKTRKAYTTFGTQQLSSALVAYLQARVERGERIGPSSPVVARNELRGVARTLVERARHRTPFVTTTNLITEVANALHASAPVGVRWRPYVLRAYCSTRLLIAEGSGLISRDLREALLGHDGGVAARYHVGKRWGAELMEEARREYARAASFLETNAQSRVDVAAEFRRALLAVSGLSEAEIAAHANDSNEKLLAILREQLTGRGTTSATTPAPDGTSRRVQRPVPLVEAERLLASGWTFVASFGPDRVVLEAPTGAARDT